MPKHDEPLDPEPVDPDEDKGQPADAPEWPGDK